MKKRWFLFTFLTTALILVGCNAPKEPQQINHPNESPQTEEQTKQPAEQSPEQTEDINQEEDNPLAQFSSNEQLKEHLIQQEEKIESLEDELNYYKKYVQDIVVTFTPEKMESLIEKEWNYDISVNNIKFPNSGELEIADQNFTLTIKEERVPYSVLPEEESLKGKIKNSLKNSFSVKSEGIKIPNPTVKEEDYSTLIEYKFENVESNTVINVTLKEDLVEKLNLSNNNLTIIVNPEA